MALMSGDAHSSGFISDLIKHLASKTLNVVDRIPGVTIKIPPLGYDIQ
jgi:hypothetical protein